MVVYHMQSEDYLAFRSNECRREAQFATGRLLELVSPRLAQKFELLSRWIGKVMYDRGTVQWTRQSFCSSRSAFPIFRKASWRTVGVASGILKLSGLEPGGFRLLAEREIKGGANVLFSLGPHTSAMFTDNAGDGRQPNAGTLKSLWRMQPLENAK
jgi:hypothetical protein